MGGLRDPASLVPLVAWASSRNLIFAVYLCSVSYANYWLTEAKSCAYSSLPHSHLVVGIEIKFMRDGIKVLTHTESQSQSLSGRVNPLLVAT